MSVDLSNGHTAWTSKAPGAVDPSKDTKDHKNHNRELMRDLVQELAAGQVPFSFFEREGLQDVLNKIAPGFDWPRRKKYAATAKDLYYEKKGILIDYLGKLGNDQKFCASTDAWTTKDQSQSYVALTIQWFEPSTFRLCNMLIDFSVSLP
ncbi:hypothetical protein PPACK8108_LOCUS21429 [Phakopsora pachyrhizi]|uniref:Uncharacterized protein n=1 Tax=Phakopsora pachyrhizi TaxID=170000 RepID=A0AAV0BHP0_PHAPC|nr:hypothetical protein PPACK8108_LOCUS21429 [Phakopsora pachyrhizi]